MVGQVREIRVAFQTTLVPCRRRKQMVIFRSIARGSIAAFAAVLIQPAPVIAADAPTTIIVLGDSLVSGNGLLLKEKFSARLQAALDAAGRAVKVDHPGYVHDSKWGLEWMTDAKGKALLAAPERHAVILELGSNDCPGLSTDNTRANLESILGKLAEKKIPTLLVGSTASTWCDPKYIAEFPKIFPDLADRYGAVL